MISLTNKIDEIVASISSESQEVPKSKFPCAICKNRVKHNHKSIFCDQCNNWVHIECNEISITEYKDLQKEPHDIKWVCLYCSILNNSVTFPFTLVSDSAFLDETDFEISSSFNVTHPSFEIASKLTNLPNLSDYDIDENINTNLNSKYYSVQELASLEVSNKDFAIFHMNIRSLPLHYEELHALLSSLKTEFRVIGLSEIKVSTNVPLKSNVDLPGYKFYHTPSHSAAGGVGIYVKQNLAANKRDDLSVSDVDFETIWIEIDNPQSKNILCCCAYRHPSSDISKFTDHLQDTLSTIADEDKIVHIMGDFNIDLLNYGDHTLTNEFINLMFSAHFMPSILHPTRITDTSSTLIDNIFLNNTTDSDIISGNLLSMISDHLPQFAIRKGNAPDYKNMSYFAHDYRQFNERNFMSDYAEFDVSYLNDENTDLDAKFDTFLLNLHILIEKHCPEKKLNKKMMKLRDKPWINFQILKMMKIRDKLFKQFKVSNSSTAFKVYKQFRNRVVNEIRKSKKNYYQQYFHENKSNMKMLWKGIKDIISLKPKNCDAFSHLVSDDGLKISEPVNIANEFNEYFTKVADEITKKIPRTRKSPLSYLSNRNLNSLLISPCTTNEVSSVIKSLKLGKSSGPNSIPVKLLKILDDSISSDLSVLINESFTIGVFPDKLKIAKVIPIFKKGVKTKTSNYRPISLLSIFSKIFEKLMQRRLQEFLETSEVLFCMQFGFRSGHSTEHALISLTESIKTTLDNKRLGCGIFIDLQKAFDTVNHEILLKKLEHYGIRDTALAWFESYLTNRRQMVSINGYNSSMCSISCGVPQGSVLGPLLFLIYINDLPNVSSMLSFFLFADDTNIYFEAVDLNTLTQTINKELSKVKSWLDCNKLALNIDKTNFVLFHSPRKIIPDQINIKFGYKKVSRAKYVKFLGVLLDEHLSWKYHITELHKKLSKTSGIFFKIRHYIPLQPLISLYHSLFSSFLNYGITAWGLTYDTYLKPLFLLQKKILRCISFQNFAAPSAPIFHSLRILKLEDMIHFNILTFAYKAINKLSPACFHNFFTPNSSVHRFGTRQVTRGDLFKSLKNTTLYGLKTIQYFGSKLWNTLPLFIRVSNSVLIFRSNLKTFFIDSYSN